MQHLFFNATLVSSGKILRENAFLVENDKIKIVGNSELLLQQFPEVTKYNSTGKIIMPAFNDAHIHIWKVGNLITLMLDLRGVKSLEEMQDKLSDFAKKSDKDWILARGFNEINFPTNKIPTAEDIDKVIPDKPTFVIRSCAHIGVANSLAMKIAKVNNQTPVPTGGEIRKNEAGSPNGIFTETALGLINNVIPKYSFNDYKEMILSANSELLKFGIASATDPAVHTELLEVYREMNLNNELSIRVNAMPIGIPDGSEKPEKLPKYFESDFLNVTAIKFFADGGLSGKTAAINGTYKNSNYSGVLRLTKDTFMPAAINAIKNNFKIATHAIGHRAIETVLYVYDKCFEVNPLKNRIEHLGFIDNTGLEQMKKQNIKAVMQPIFIYELGKNFENYLSDKFLEKVYPVKTVNDSGVELAFSTDAPVVKEINPFVGIKAALERKTISGSVIGTNEKINIEAALKNYTEGGALADGSENKKGKLAENYFADFIITDKNPIEVPENDLDKIKVLETWVGGKLKYSAGNL